jgi:hypothetical protein
MCDDRRKHIESARPKMQAISCWGEVRISMALEYQSVIEAIQLKKSLKEKGLV